MTSQRILGLCRRLGRKRIIVLGDVMLDHYLNGGVRRISPEAPVAVVEYETERFVPGGAANVARNLASLGAEVELFGAVGPDAAAATLRNLLRTQGVGCQGVVTDPSRQTTTKTRIVANHQQMLRIDRENSQPLPISLRQTMLTHLGRAMDGAAALILADYAKGVIDQKLYDAATKVARSAGVPICVDPKPTRPLRIVGCSLLTPNRRETFELAGMPDEPVGARPIEHEGLRRAIATIRRHFRPETLLVTLGESGMILVDSLGRTSHLETAAREVYDVSGAGDTVIATYVLATTAGASPIDAATIANIAAGIVVGKLGTATVSVLELEAGIQAMPLRKISRIRNRLSSQPRRR